VRVDGLTYSFLGSVASNLVNGSVNSTNFYIGPVNSVISGQAGPMEVNLTFFSPIEVCSHPSVSFNAYICNL
jgi:hypothetical protein